MDWLDETLQDGEEVIFRTRTHLYQLFSSFLIITMGLFNIWFLLPGILYFIFAIGYYFYHEYVITDRRVIIKQGLFYIRTEGIMLDQIDHVIIRQSLLDTIIQGGTIFIFGSSISTKKLSGLGKPSVFRNALYSQLPVTTMSFFNET